VVATTMGENFLPHLKLFNEGLLPHNH